MKTSGWMGLAVWAALGAAACAAATEETTTKEAADAGGAQAAPALAAPPLPAAATLWFEPADHVTHAEGTALRVGVKGASFTSGAAVLGAAGSRLRLETWPERAPVEATIRIDTPAEESDAIATITPAAPLADRWYVVTASSADVRLSGADGAPVRRLDAQTIGARFRPGSEPSVAAVRRCGEGDDSRVYVDFSEAVPTAERAEAAKEHGPRYARSILHAQGAAASRAPSIAVAQSVQRVAGQLETAAVDWSVSSRWGACEIVRF